MSLVAVGGQAESRSRVCGCGLMHSNAQSEDEAKTGGEIEEDNAQHSSGSQKGKRGVWRSGEEEERRRRRRWWCWWMRRTRRRTKSSGKGRRFVREEHRLGSAQEQHQLNLSGRLMEAAKVRWKPWGEKGGAQAGVGWKERCGLPERLALGGWMDGGVGREGKDWRHFDGGGRTDDPNCILRAQRSSSSLVGSIYSKRRGWAGKKG
jgi:hypothetical protein